MKKADIEKSLKRFLKRKVSYSFALLIAFMISGEIVSASGTENVKYTEETEMKAKDAKDLVSLFKILKNKTVVQKSEDKSTQFFFSVWLEKRKAKKYADNGFKEWGESNINPENPDIEIPDIITPIRPNIKDPESAIPNEDFIGAEPKFEFNPVGSIAMGEIPQDITINVTAPKVPVSEIGDGDFNIFNKDDVSAPEDIEEGVGGIGTVPDLAQETTAPVVKPTVEYSGNIATFIPPEIPKVQVGEIKVPASFNIDAVKITTGTVNQDTTTDYAKQKSDYVVKNYTSYEADEKGFNIWFNASGIYYDDTDTRGNKKLILNDNTTLYNKDYIDSYDDKKMTTNYISDIIGKDVSVKGPFTLTYQGNRANGADEVTAYVRIFLTSSSKGLQEINSEGVKITEFTGNLNLATTNEPKKGSTDYNDLKGNLIGMEHQLWNTGEKNSVLINSGNINIGKRLDPYEDNKKPGGTEITTNVVNKNMIGIMIDYAGGNNLAETIKNKTINAGIITIAKPAHTSSGKPDANLLNPSNNIGISFEEISNKNQAGAVLNDEVYIGNINIGDNTNNNYGFRMGNIYNKSANYFDETKIIGNLDSGTTITFDNNTNIEKVEGYESKIDVKGTENIGMVVGKSLSSTKNENPIANFENISIEVNGKNNIGFLRDKNYSNNNTNDMVINDKNITDISFGENATNSVLIRSEQYGIKLDRDLDVSSGKAKDGEYNVVLQATRQTWNNGTNDINSVGSVENSGKLSGKTNRMVGVMSSGTLTDGVDTWQNGDNTLYGGKALAKNSGTISFEGTNNIGMAVLDGNSGENTGTISITGDNGVGIYNEDGTITAGGKIDIKGNNSVGIYSTGGTLNLSRLGITLGNSDATTLADTGTTGIYVSNGTVNFGNTADTKTTIKGDKNSQAGVYGTGDITVSGYVDITKIKAGVVSAAVGEGNTATKGNITVKGGHISYNGDGYALYTDNQSKITLDNNSSLTLAGNAYGMNIDTSRTDKAIDFGGAKINIESDNVVVFNAVNKGSRADITVSSSNHETSSGLNFENYVGKYTINAKKDGQFNEEYGYKIASIDGGTINLDEKTKNIDFLKKYKFQRSNVNVSSDIDMKLSSVDADKYFNGEVIGIGQSSSQNIDKNATEENQRAETTININGATVTADRTEKVDNDKKSTIGAYIDYGEISLTNGKIVVEDDGTDTTNNVANNNGIGIYAKNGSKVTTDNRSSITVHGNNGVGIFAEATKTEEIKDDKNKFGGSITTLEISNAGDITLDGQSGVGIYADNSKNTDKVNKAVINNTGEIIVGDSDLTNPDNLNTSIGIYGSNTAISNTGTIKVGKAGAGIYAENSVVKVSGQGSIALGDSAEGIHLDKDSIIQGTNEKLVFKNEAAANNTTRTGIHFAGSTETNKNAEIDFNIDMSEVNNGRAIVSDGRNITLSENKTITVSGNGGRGIRVANAKATNSGNIVINKTQGSGTAVGLLAVDTNGTLDNSGTITVEGQSGIGIYAENDTENKTDNKKTGNSIKNIGTINLGADKAIGVGAKNTDVILNNNDNISFSVTENNNNDGTTTTKNATNSIGIYAEGGTVKNNKSEFTVTGSGKDKLENKNIGIYLGNGASYTGNGSLKVENGAIGIYADKGASSLENINILSDSQGVQTVGVVLNGENKKEKTISGNIKLTNSTTEESKVGGKNIGVYAKNSTVNIKDGETLTLNYSGSNGTGIYLDDSALSGSGTIQIKGTPNSLKTSNSIGVYYSGNSNSAEHKVKLEIDKSNTIGVFASADSSFVREADISIGKYSDNSVENITGIVVSDGASAENRGTITLGNVNKGTGMAAVEGTDATKTAKLTNSGNIVISKNAVRGTGVFLSGNSQFAGENGTITIQKEGTDTQLGIGIYALGENAKINSTGKFDMKKGNTAVYSDGADISSDINLNTGSNQGTTALVIKSDRNSAVAGVTKGTTVGGTADKKMNITLAKNSTGIYALDSGVKIENVSIDATAHIKENEENNHSYGIYLAEDNGKTYSINNTDVSIVKGTGIVLSSSETAKTNLKLTESNIKVNSYSEGAGGTGTNSSETGIGIYGGKGSTITLNGGNKLDVSYGTGIYSENGTISIGAGAKEDTINLQGYSVGLYSKVEGNKTGKIVLGKNTNITFNTVEGAIEKAGDTKGAAAYSDGGTITSSANITGDKNANLNGFIALLGKNSTIENTGDIALTGEAVSGISAQGGTITNSGTITVEDNNSAEGNHMSTGIYSEGASVESTAGTINVNGASAGIAYTGDNISADIKAGNININGTLNIGVSLNGKANSVTIGDIVTKEGNIKTSDSNLGVYINNFESSNMSIGNITLGDKSLGVYADSTTNSIGSLGQIKVGKEGIGVAVTNNGNLTINGDFKVNAGAGGTGVYVGGKDSSLTVQSLAGVNVGEAGAMVHVNGGKLTLGTTAGDIVLDNCIGIVLQNGGNIKSNDNSKISNMTVTNGGIGIVVKDGNSNRPDIFGTDTTITLGDGNQNGKLYSAGIYYQDAGDIGEITKANIQYVDGASYTIGTIFDNTYGTLTNSHITMNNTINNSIGVMIKKDKVEDVDKTITFTAEKAKNLIDVNGDHNVGILGQDSTIVTTGNIVVGTETTSDNSVGVYLTGDNEGIKHTYTGEGNITVGSNSQGIYAKNYKVTQTGDITVTDGVGIAGIITDDYKGSSGINLTGNITIKGDTEGNTVGIYGKGTDITANGKINISGVNNIGIFSSEKGDINFTGETVKINGAGSIGIYKDTEETKDQFEETEINVSKGEWNLGDKTIGIAARGEGKDNITITNSADMTLGAGAMGIYSVGKNTVKNSGNINVGAGIQGTETDTASIGIYMANRFGGAYAVGSNTGIITADENGAVGVQSAGYAEIINEKAGVINVSNNGTGMISTLGAKVINKGNISVTDSGVGMIADGINSAGIKSEAINYGEITLNKTEKYNPDEALIGMGAYNGGKIINAKEGTITVNAGTGMYFDKQSSFENNGKIVLNDGIGIMGTGVTVNNGGTIIVNGGTATANPDNVTEENSHTGSIVADNINRVVYVNDNFVNVGGILKTDFNIKLNNPTVDITAGGAGFEGADISGQIALDSKFALTGNGISYSVEDFVKPDSDITVSTSPLFVSSLNDGNLTVNKVAYRKLTAGSYFDTRDNALDDILVQAGKDADALKKLNYYLNSIKDISVFNSEAERTMGELGGNIYANVQSRMQDINRAFDSSLDEMISSHNPAPVNDKFSMIHTNGEYENSNAQLVGYDYSITGLNYMREYDNLNRKYGFNLGFAVSKFDFDDSGSKEDVYSLRAGVHNVKWFENGISLTSQAEAGYNRHETDRKINLGYGTYEADSDFNSYHVSLNNKVRKSIFKDEKTEFGAYTGLNLEYGRFDKIKEHDIADLKVKAGDYMSSKAFVGADVQNTQYLPNDWAVKFKGDIQYSYDFGENYDENKASINGSDYYSLMSELETKGAVSGKIGVSLEKSDYMSISLEGNYTKDLEREEDYWRAGVRFTYKFYSDSALETLKNPMGFLENHFDFDSDVLKESEKNAIEKTSELINRKNVKGTIVIEGHTDNIGKEEYNQFLSEKRAKAVEKEFKANIKKSENINYQLKGYGEGKPDADNSTSEGRAANRRVELKFKQN